MSLTGSMLMVIRWKSFPIRAPSFFWSVTKIESRMGQMVVQVV